MKPFTAFATTKAQFNHRYLESESWKKGIAANSQHLFHQKIAAPKKSYSSGRKSKNSYMFRPTILPKKYGFHQKGSRIFSGQTLRRKSKGSQKKYEFDKKRNSYFLGRNNVRKKSMGSKKSMSSKKGNHTFSGQHSAKKR